MKLYIKVNEENVIIDAIGKPYEGYIETEVPKVPIGIFDRWYKYEGGEIVPYPELKPDFFDIREEMKELKLSNALLDEKNKHLKQEDLNNKEAIAELYLLSMGGF